MGESYTSASFGSKHPGFAKNEAPAQAEAYATKSVCGGVG